MMSMQKTIEERNKSIDKLDQKLRDANMEANTEQQKWKELSQSLTNQLESLRQQKGVLEGKLEVMTKKMELVTSGMYSGTPI